MTTWQTSKNVIKGLLVIIALLSYNVVFAEVEYLSTYIERLQLNPSPIKSFVQEVAVLEILEDKIIEVDSLPLGLSEAVHFNKDGFVSALIFFDNASNGQVYWERFYDSRCNKESFFYRYDRRKSYSLNAYIEYQYDSECHIMSEVSFYYDDETYEPHPLQKDNDGNIIAFHRYKFKGVKRETIYNRFDERLEQYSYDETGTVTYYSSEPYKFTQPLKQETTAIASTEDIVVEADGSITYWQNNKLLKREVLDSKGNVIVEEFYSLEKGTVFTRSEFYPLGHLKERSYFDDDGKFKSSKKCHYEYDRFENWISQTCFNNSLNKGELESEIPYRIVRRIEYY